MEISEFSKKKSSKNFLIINKTWDTCSWKGQLVRTRSWQVLSWKVHNKIGKIEVGKLGLKLESTTEVRK